MNLGKTHVLAQHGPISAPGHILDGRIICVTTTTTKAKKYGEPGTSEVKYRLEENDAPAFDSFKQLQEFYEGQNSSETAKI